MYTFMAQFSVTPVPTSVIRSVCSFAPCRCVAVLLLAAVLAACSPQYDWRELIVAEGQIRAAFPARVQTETRTVRLGDVSTPFTVVAASVNDATFAVGHARLPPEVARDSAHRRRLASHLLSSAYTNLGATPPAEVRPGPEAVVVRGEGARAGTWSLVKVWVLPDGPVQAIAMGRDGDLSMERAREFVDQVVMAP